MSQINVIQFYLQQYQLDTEDSLYNAFNLEGIKIFKASE